MKEILSSIRTTRIHAFTKRRRPTYHFQHQNPLPAAALLFVVVVVIFACRASCVVCHRHGSCAGSSGSNGTWPCRAGAKCGSGSISCRSRNARATCRSKRSPHFPRTPSFARGTRGDPTAAHATVTYREIRNVCSTANVALGGFAQDGPSLCPFALTKFPPRYLHFSIRLLSVGSSR